jgi:hypothetical protein
MSYSGNMGNLNESHPELVAQWHYDLNGSLLPTDVSAGSDKRVSWICTEGHIYECRVKDRVKATKCAVCSNRRLVSGVNDLLTKFPDLANEWHPSKNMEPDPANVPGGGSLQAWWICRLGHEWQVKISSRVFFGSQCPFCSNSKVWTGFNDLASTHPDLAKEWDFTKNGALTPEQVMAGTSKKVWWTCDYGHSWSAVCSSRASKGVGCPVCAGKAVQPGVNDLKTTHPDLAEQWVHDANLPALTSTISAGNHHKFSWQCEHGHIWLASPSNRSTKNSNCPFCAGQRVIPGENDLATTHPELIAEWHPTRNGQLKPTEIMAGHDRKVWWKCSEGHEWSAPPYNRKNGVGCSTCANTGYGIGDPGYLYLLAKEHLGLQQFGISNSPTNRVAQHKKNGWEVVDVIGPADGRWILETETALKEFFRDRDLLLPRDYPEKFDGYTESWDASSMSFSSISEMLRSLRDSEWGEAS